MSSDSAAPRPERGPSYFCDYTTRLSRVLDVTDRNPCTTTHVFSVARPTGDSKSTKATKDG
jgi:hypothetical protein